MAKEMIRAQDDRIVFRRSQFSAMAIHRPSPLMPNWELVIWTQAWSGGRIFGMESEDQAKAISKEVADQL